MKEGFVGYVSGGGLGCFMFCLGFFVNYQKKTLFIHLQKRAERERPRELLEHIFRGKSERIDI